MPSPPKPDLNLVNTGAIIDQPFLFQANNPSTCKVPSTLTFMTKSTLIPGGTAEGTATYTHSPLNALLGESQVTSGAVKTTQYLYTAPDPSAIIAGLEAKLVQQETECVELESQTGVAAEAIASARQRLKTTKEKLATAKKQGAAAPPRLTATKWTEIGDGDLVVKGEAYFEYEGTDIIHSISTVMTMESPPRVDQLDTDYRYNDLGQVAEIETAGAVTWCEYDVLGRLSVKHGNFISPAGDFLAVHRTVFTYSPPIGDPNQIPPPNAVLSSVNDSISGSQLAFEVTPEPMKQIPEPVAPGMNALVSAPKEETSEPKGWLAKLLGKAPEDPAAIKAIGAPNAIAPPPLLDLTVLEGDFDKTRVQSLYAYP
ncbi:MAG: YD repeat-containing protein [Planctomycetota bacterium]|jgi:YD repeat-containing protein